MPLHTDLGVGSSMRSAYTLAPGSQGCLTVLGLAEVQAAGRDRSPCQLCQAILVPTKLCDWVLVSSPC